MSKRDYRPNIVWIDREGKIQPPLPKRPLRAEQLVVLGFALGFTLIRAENWSQALEVVR